MSVTGMATPLTARAGDGLTVDPARDGDMYRTSATPSATTRSAGASRNRPLIERSRVGKLSTMTHLDPEVLPRGKTVTTESSVQRLPAGSGSPSRPEASGALARFHRVRDDGYDHGPMPSGRVQLRLFRVARLDDQVVVERHAPCDVAPHRVGQVLVARGGPEDDTSRVPEGLRHDLDRQQRLAVEPPVHCIANVGAEHVGALPLPI